MALSSVLLKKIQQETEEKKKGATGKSGASAGAGYTAPAVSVGGSLGEKIAQDVALKKLGITDYDSEKGMDGFERYLAEREQQRKAKEKDEEDEKWWEKLGRYLSYAGTAGDSTLPTNKTNIAINALREDTSWKEPSDEWADKDKALFGYLYETDRKAAEEYAVSVNNAINKAKADVEKQKIKDNTTANFGGIIGGAVESVVSSPLGGADFLMDMAEKIARGEITEKDYLSPFEKSQVKNEEIAGQLNEKHGTLDESIPIIGGKGFGDVYGLGTSIAQSSAVAYTGGAPQALIQFFGSVAASAVDDARARGASDEQAIGFGILSGLAEAIPEALGIDSLLKIGSSGTLKSFMKNILKQSGVEAFEEGMTSVINNFADNLVMGDFSNFNLMVEELMANGMSEEEAKKRAWIDIAEGIAFDSLAGFVSGGIHAGPQIAFQTIAENRNTKKTQERAQEAAGEAVAKNATTTEAKEKTSSTGGKGLRVFVGRGNPAQDIQEYVKGFENATKDTPAQISSMYDPADGLSAEDFARGAEEAYRFGTYSYPIKNMEAEGTFSKSLPSEKRLQTYYIARNNAEEANIAKAKEIQKKVLPGVKGDVVIEGNLAVQKLTRKQEAEIKLAGTLAEITGVKTHIFASYVYKGKEFSYTNSEGDIVTIEPGMRVWNNGGKIEEAPNGWDDIGKHEIWADINAGSMGQGTFLYTLVHEYIHNIEPWSAEHYNVFVKITAEAFERSGKSFEDAVAKKYEKYKKKHSKTTLADAQEEVVAETMSALLRDKKGLKEFSSQVYKQDRTLWEKIKDWFKDVIAAITNAYKNLAPESEEARMLMEQKDLFEQAQKVFAEAVVTAGQNYKAYSEMAGVQIDKNTDSVAPSVMFSERTWSESEYVRARTETARAISGELNVSLDQAYDYIDSINGVARLIADDRVRLDYEPNLDENATVLKPNSEYGVTVDMSTLCAKRLLTTGTFDAIQKRLPDMVFDSEDIVKLRKMMMDRGYEVACGICYVESTRREMGRITQEFIDRYKIAQQTGKPIARVNASGQEVVLKSQGKTFMADKEYTPNLGELNTTDIDYVKRDHPEVYNAYLAFMNARGQSKPKLLETRAEYKGEILKHFKQKKTVDKKNREGGLRLQSFSDFELPHLIDMMQIVMDMSRVGLKSQAYTKVPKFAEAFGGTGIKINLSLIAKGSGVDADGNLIFDDIEGINHEEAFRIRERFSQNVGTILVGKNDEHIRAAMADPRIDMIIPFHKSSWKESLYEALGLTGYTDYTKYQMEKPIDKSRGKIEQLHSDKYWDYSKTGDENAQIYLQECREDGRTPVFPQFQNEPGYWKMLIDFKMYDNDGVGAPHEVVKPIFDNEYNAKILDEYKGGHRKLPVAQDVVDDFVKEYDTGTKFQDRDSDDSVSVYHGSKTDFDSFDFSKLKDELGVFFAEDENGANQYGNAKAYTLTPKKTLIVHQGKEYRELMLTGETDVEKRNRLIKEGYDTIKLIYNKPGGGETVDWVALTPNVINKTPTENPDIRYSERDSASKPRSAQAQRDEGYMLNENKFYQFYSIHQLDIGGRWGSIDEQIKSIRQNGFHGGSGAVNVLPASSLRMRTDSFGNPIFSDITQRQYAPKKGDAFLLVPRSGLTKDMAKVEQGFKPLDYEIVTADYDYQSPYEMYEKAYEMSAKGTDIKYSERDSYKEGLSEEDRKNAEEVIRGLRNTAMGARYGVGSTAAYTVERIEREISYSFGHSADYAKSYITWVEPVDFIYATTASEQNREQLKKEAGSLDLERLVKETQPIHLTVDFETGEIIGHEGRHRMLALQDAGIRKVAIIIDSRNDDVHHTKPVDMMKLKGQSFGEFRKGTGFYLHDMLPLSARYADVAKELFTQETGSGIRFQERLSVEDRNRVEILENKVKRLDGEIKKMEANAVLAGQMSQGKAMAKEMRLKSKAFEEAIARKKEQIAEVRARRDELLEKAKAEKADAVARVRQEARDRLEKRISDVKAEKNAQIAALRKRRDEKQDEIREKYRDYIKTAIEGRHKTLMRAKIRRVVNELDDLLRHGGKERHVPERMKAAVAKALDVFNVFDPTYYKNRIRNLEQKIADEQDPAERAKLKVKLAKILEQREKAELELTMLKASYDELEESGDSAFDPVVAKKIKAVAEELEHTRFAKMSLEQLQNVYDLFAMLKSVISKSNKLFAQQKAESIAEIGEKVIAEVREVGGKHPLSLKATKGIRAFSWNNLKPIYAFERIGSAALTDVFKSIRKGEDTWAKDIGEAIEFFETASKKYNFENWDKKKSFDFVSSAGDKFSLNIGQAMSIYAYSKRKDADKHLSIGGFVFDPKTEIKKGLLKYEVNNATAHNISPETILEIAGKLTDEQRAFVDEMQTYLSEVMGEKGNEVSMAMYDVKLFNEKNYFPLKSANQYLFEQNNPAGEIKLKNSGFTKSRVPGANNPVVLSDFIDVWANHVNDMSMYHAFVLPIEDFNRVYNYKTSLFPNQKSVKGVVQNAYGKEANDYISGLITDLNGGARVDRTAGIINKLIGGFKKASVFASASVVIQQPSSIVRAHAIIGDKYFYGLPKIENHKKLWEEIKKYAPVAIIKEMGYFDTNMGRSTVDYIKGEKTFKTRVDDFFSFAPAYADEVTWCIIWNAVKRETKAKNPDLNSRSEEFLNICGERLTEVVVKTQVYDSVLSRSANMRSKDTGMKMATAFMAEATTSINMLEDAVRQWKRGNKKQATNQIAAVYGSILLNATLVSLVYAARDDDEDENYLEKYIGSLTTEIIDGMNPLTYVPFIKDIWSIAQGFDVERADMSLATKLIEAFEKASTTIFKDTSDMDEEEKADHKKEINEAVLGIVDYIAALFGQPVKNIRRDLGAAKNLVETIMRGQKSSMGSIFDQIIDSAKNAVPGWGWVPDETKGDKLYDAIRRGDKTYAERLEGGFKSESSRNSALRGALRDNDPRIREAALARINGDPATYMKIARAIIADGFSQDDVVKAINSEINAINKGESESSSVSKATGFFKADDYIAAIRKGDQAAAQVVRNDIISTAMANGKDLEDAEKSFMTSFKSAVWEAYENRELSQSQVSYMLTNYAEMEDEEVQLKFQVYEWKASVPGADDITASAIADYNEFAEPAGISKADYYRAWRIYNDTDADVDPKTGEGVAYSKVKKVMPQIDALPLTPAQKTALAKCWWAESTVRKYKTW